MTAGGDERSRTLVTLDGPAGSGKSTTAREVARRLGYRYLDSGALYRALTHALLERGVPPERWSDLGDEDLEGLGVSVRPGEERVEIRLDGRVLDEELRTEEVTRRVSDLARLPAVRHWLLGAQREAGREGRLVADGRDMGTVVFPEAAAKFFIEADVEERARRRLGDRGIDDPDPGAVREEAARLSERDRKDATREHSPLEVPPDAEVVDTTDLTFEEQVEAIVGRARAVAAGGGGEGGTAPDPADPSADPA